MDKLVFDIETKNSFDDVGGRENLKKLEVSVVGVYSYDKDEYACFEEHELPKLAEMLRNTRLLIGFASKRFDVPVLEKYFNFNIAAIPHYDILEEVEAKLGRRIGLGILAEANIGAGKSGHGIEAIELYRRGEIEKLKTYCVNDVKITKEIFDLICAKGELWIPQRNSSQMRKIEVTYKEPEESPQGQLF